MPAPPPNRQAGWIGKLLLWLLAAIGALTVALVTVGVMTYDPAPEPERAEASAPTTLKAGSASLTLDAEAQATYARSCAICHETAGTGAPRRGDADAWQARLDQGMPTLLEHTISGHAGMPPMGMCMDCSQAQFVAFIEYMAGVDSGMECGE